MVVPVSESRNNGIHVPSRRPIDRLVAWTEHDFNRSAKLLKKFTKTLAKKPYEDDD